MIFDLLVAAAGAAGAVVPNPTAQFIEFKSSDVSNKSFTFSNVNFGTPAAGRLVVLQLAARAVSGFANASSVTIGGVPATLIQNTAMQSFTCLCAAVVPTGSTGDVVVNLSANCINCAIGVNAIYGATSATPTSSARDTASNMSGIGITLTNQGGEAVMAALSTNTALTADAWTGVTETFDTLVANMMRAGALATNAAAGTYTVGATTSEPGNLVLCAAGWK